MADELTWADTDEDYEGFGVLVREYWDWLQVRYADLPGFVDDVGGVQAIDVELATLRDRYGPPAGRVVLARRDGQVTGGVAYRDLGDGACEMKRLYVPDRFAGHGTGRALVEAILVAAAADGFTAMRLDTGVNNIEAMAMYTSLGFVACPPFHDYPADLLPHLRFMERPLSGAG